MEELIKSEFQIEDMIYEIRGKQVMLDSDLAKLYQCKNGTKTINQAVKRNINRFPSDFCFEITTKELFEICGPNLGPQKIEESKKRFLPKVFTEQGVAMLATVIKTEVASQVSINIMRAFVYMRKYISNSLAEQKLLEKQVLKNTEEIESNRKQLFLLQESFKKLEEKKVVNEIYFNGQIYDAYSKILDIFNEAQNEIIIIDGYADKVFLDIVRNLEKSGIRN